MDVGGVKDKGTGKEQHTHLVYKLQKYNSQMQRLKNEGRRLRLIEADAKAKEKN